MQVFVVFKVAVYRHECGGVFSTLKAARVAALQLINGERDDHHDYEVVPFELDVMTMQTPKTNTSDNVDPYFWIGGDLEEAEAVLMFKRNGDDVTEHAKK